MGSPNLVALAIHESTLSRHEPGFLDQLRIEHYPGIRNASTGSTVYWKYTPIGLT